MWHDSKDISEGFAAWGEMQDCIDEHLEFQFYLRKWTRKVIVTQNCFCFSDNFDKFNCEEKAISELRN